MAQRAGGRTIGSMELHDPRHDALYRHEFEAAVGLMLFTAVAMIAAIAVLLII